MLYIVFIAVLNLGLGFGLAMFLARRYQDFVLMSVGEVDFSGDLGVPGFDAGYDLDEDMAEGGSSSEDDELEPDAGRVDADTVDPTLRAATATPARQTEASDTSRQDDIAATGAAAKGEQEFYDEDRSTGATTSEGQADEAVELDRAKRGTPDAGSQARREVASADGPEDLAGADRGVEPELKTSDRSDQVPDEAEEGATATRATEGSGEEEIASGPGTEGSADANDDSPDNVSGGEPDSEDAESKAGANEPEAIPDAAAGASDGAADQDTSADDAGQRGQAAVEPSAGETRATADVMTECRSQSAAYQHELVDLDAQLRQCADDPVADRIQECLSSIQKTNQKYLDDRLEAKRAFEDLTRQLEESAAVEQVESALAEEVQQIESTQQTIGDFDFGADLSAECRQVVDETSKLLGANHQVRDCLDAALSQFERELHQEPDAAEPSDTNHVDELTELPNRAGITAALGDWWEKDPHRVRKLCVAVLDIDEFAKLNRLCGHHAGDGVLRALGKLIAAECRTEHSTARLSGQQFLIMLPDCDSRQATNLVERLRQMIESSQFIWHQSEFQVTVSGAVTEAHANDTTERLFDRLSATLREAKRYGRNRTFLHEGKYPAPVVPPNFALEARTIEV